MGFLKSIIKKFIEPSPGGNKEEIDESSKEAEIIVRVAGEKVDEVEEESGAENYLRYLRTVRKEQDRPQVDKIDVSEEFYSYSGCEFDFSDVPVAQFKNGVNWYLLDEANADKIFDDIEELNKFAFQAEQVADVPDFRAPLMDILLNPEWIENGFDMRWKMSHFSPQPLTKTGKFPKYPIKVFLVSRSGNYEARLIIITDPTTAGYYRPTNTDQSIRFIKSMRHRAAETLAVADATERALMEENGQESMEDW